MSYLIQNISIDKFFEKLNFLAIFQNRCGPIRFLVINNDFFAHYPAEYVYVISQYVYVI